MNKYQLYNGMKNKILPPPAGSKLTIHEDDVFLASYPRSGNTWSRFLLGTLINQVPMRYSTIDQFVPDIYGCSDRELLKIKRPRLLKSHEVFDPKYKKVIYIVRDVRDVAISYYFWHKKFEPTYNDSFDRFLEKFVFGSLDTYGTWGSNVRSWLDNVERVERGFMLIKYEDLRSNTSDALKEVLKFLDINRSEEQIQQSIGWCSFDNMKSIEKQERDSARALRRSNKAVDFTRKGKSGSWQEFLTELQRSLIEYEFGDIMIRLGYEI